MRTELMNITAGPETTSIARRGVCRDSSSRTGLFTESLSAASRELPTSRGVQRTAITNDLAVGEYLRISGRTGSVDRSMSTSEPSRTSGSVATPFDNRSSDGNCTAPDKTKSAEWRDYFRTHAPSQWWHNESARSHFQEIYGKNALVALDWTCNVPENIDPNFVLHVPLDSAGKPIPRSQQG